MSNIIKIDTEKIDDYINRLAGLKNTADNLDSNLIWYAKKNDYDNIKWTLNNVGKPSDFIWRIDKNINYLNEIKTKANNVESFLVQIDPLNYDKSLQAIEQKNSFFTELFVSLSSFDTTMLEIPIIGDAVKLVSSIYSAVQKGDFGSIVKGLGSGCDFIIGAFKEVMNSKIVSNFFGAISSTTSNFFKGAKTFINGCGDFVGKAVGVVTDALVTGYENFAEFGEFSARMVAETFLEFSIDQIITYSGALLVGGAALLAGAAVPTLGVAVLGGIALKCVADWISVSITGKDVSENIADKICDDCGIIDESEVKEPEIKTQVKYEDFSKKIQIEDEDKPYAVPAWT